MAQVIQEPFIFEGNFSLLKVKVKNSDIMLVIAQKCCFHLAVATLHTDVIRLTCFGVLEGPLNIGQIRQAFWDVATSVFVGTLQL